MWLSERRRRRKRNGAAIKSMFASAKHDGFLFKSSRILRTAPGRFRRRSSELFDHLADPRNLPRRIFPSPTPGLRFEPLPPSTLPVCQTRPGIPIAPPTTPDAIRVPAADHDEVIGPFGHRCPDGQPRVGCDAMVKERHRHPAVLRDGRRSQVMQSQRPLKPVRNRAMQRLCPRIKRTTPRPANATRDSYRTWSRALDR